MTLIPLHFVHGLASLTRWFACFFVTAPAQGDWPGSVNNFPELHSFKSDYKHDYLMRFEAGDMLLRKAVRSPLLRSFFLTAATDM
jgi:hypothetical protein